MKTCKKCNKEFDENLTYCPFCGAENSDRKLTYVERKKAREEDTEYILSKASIQQRDIDNAKSANASDVVADKIADLKRAKQISLTRIFASLTLMLAPLLAAYLTVQEVTNPNIKWLIIVAVFLIVAFGASVFISEIYVYRALKEIEKSNFLVKKVYFNKGPIFSYSGSVYELKTNKSCEECTSLMHIEEMDGEIYIVCSNNRSHIFKVDKEAFISDFKDKIEQK